MSPALLLAIQLSCGLALGLTGVTLGSLALLRRRPPPAPPRWPAIAILRPCEGDEPLLYENLLSSATAPYGGPRRVIYLVPGAADGAHGPCQAAAQAARDAGVPAEVVLTGVGEGAGNRKVAQLAAGLPRAGEAEVIVQADSDVLLLGGDLEALVSALLGDDRVAAAFASPAELRPETAADRASAALVTASQQNFLALYAVARATFGTPSLAGALCAHRREALERIGGFAPLHAYLGEDYEIARRFVAAGYRVAASRGPARCTDGGRGPREVLGRVARWLMVVRAQRPALLLGYPLALASTPLQLALACLLRDPLHGAMAMGLWALRAALALYLGRIHERPRASLMGELGRAALDVWRAELLLLLGLARSLRSRRIEWRGRAYRVEAGGRLAPTA